MAKPQIDTKYLASTNLFSNTTPEEIDSMLGCLGAHFASYKKDEYIYMMGQEISSLGLVLSGKVRMENVDIWGNVSLLNQCGPGAVFAEIYAAVPHQPLMVNVIAETDCSVLFCNVQRILTTCPHACAHHARIAENLLTIFARKNLQLSQRIFNVAPKSIRGKLVSYLSTQATASGSNEFDIPFNRQQLADYLGVDRSALSNELSKMQKEGLLETKRSHFVLSETMGD